MTRRYLSGTQAAHRAGLRPSTWRSYATREYTPEPDVWVGDVPGWLPETIDRWDRQRPGQGARTDRNAETPLVSRS